MTVSRALREPDRVSEETRNRIHAAIEKLGYVPDPAARTLAAKRSDIIGVIVPSVTNSVFSDVMNGIYSVAENTPYQIQFGNSHYSPIEEERLLKTFLGQKPVGLIVSGIDQTPISKAMLEKAPCRVVQIMETSPDPIDMIVGFSHRDSAVAATRHLLDQGYKKPGVLAARMDPRAQRRVDGFRQVATERGRWNEEAVVTTSARSSVTLGGHLMADLLSKVPETDAVLCNNDDLALGALFECQRRGIKVPEDMGICGFNDLEMMAAAYPSLTSVRTFRSEIGKEATRMLLAALSGEGPTETMHDVGFEVIARQSTQRRSS